MKDPKTNHQISNPKVCPVNFPGIWEFGNLGLGTWVLVWVFIQSIPLSYRSLMSSKIEALPDFFKIFPRCVLMVYGLTKSFSAICSVLNPEAHQADYLKFTFAENITQI